MERVSITPPVSCHDCAGSTLGNALMSGLTLQDVYTVAEMSNNMMELDAGVQAKIHLNTLVEKWT